MNAITRPRIASGAVEAIKWIALVCMVVDHANAVLYGRHLGVVADVVGRIAFPLFAGIFGYNLARPGADFARAGRRLLAFGVLAEPASAYVFGRPDLLPLNILFSFGVALLVIRELDAGRPWFAAAAFLVGGMAVEYWWPGVAIVVATWAMARSPHPLHYLPAVGLALAALCVLVNGNGYALLAVPVAAAVIVGQPVVPRLRMWFWWFYPLHLGALALVVALR